VAAIDTANAAGGFNTIRLAPGFYVLNRVNNHTYGPSALPVIAAGD
jgi:hypothetical protein